MRLSERLIAGMLFATIGAASAGAAMEAAPGGAVISPKETIFRKALAEALPSSADLTVSARTAATGAWTILSIEHGTPPHGDKPATWILSLQGDGKAVKIRQWAIAEGCPT